MRAEVSLIHTLGDYISYLKPEGLMRDGMHLPATELAQLDACLHYLGIDREILQLEEDGKYRIDPYNAQLLRGLLVDAKGALERLREDGVNSVPVLRDFVYDDNGIAIDQPKLQKFLNQTRMIAVVPRENNDRLELHTTMHSRQEVVDAIRMVCPHIATDVETKMYSQGVDPKKSGMLPMTQEQVLEFRAAYRLIGRKMLSESPRAAANEMATLYRTGEKKQREARKEQVVSRVEEGREVVVISTRDRKESVNHFMFPVAMVQQPFKNLLERIELAASNKATGENEKLRHSPQHEVWVGMSDRLHTVAEGQLLKNVLHKAYPELQEDLDSLECVTVFPSTKNPKQTYTFRQKLGEATEMPAMDEETRKDIKPHRAESWLAVPPGKDERIWQAISIEQSTLHDAMRGLEEQFNREGWKAEPAMQQFLDDCADRGILSEKVVAQSIRDKTTPISRG